MHVSLTWRFTDNDLASDSREQAGLIGATLEGSRMVFKPTSSWALSFLSVMIVSGVIFEDVDMTAPIEAASRFLLPA